MIPKMIRVDTPYDCPYHKERHEDGREHFYCFHPKNSQIVGKCVDDEAFPEHCPLTADGA